MAEGKYELGKTHRYRQSGPHRQLEDHRRHRRSAGGCQNPNLSGPADPRPGAASRFIPDNLRAENRLPTQADGAARSEFRACGAIWNTSRPSERCAAQASRNNIGIFINQKDD